MGSHQSGSFTSVQSRVNSKQQTGDLVRAVRLLQNTVAALYQPDSIWTVLVVDGLAGESVQKETSGMPSCGVGSCVQSEFAGTRLDVRQTKQENKDVVQAGAKDVSRYAGHEVVVKPEDWQGEQIRHDACVRVMDRGDGQS